MSSEPYESHVIFSRFYTVRIFFAVRGILVVILPAERSKVFVSAKSNRLTSTALTCALDTVLSSLDNYLHVCSIEQL